MWKSCSLTIRLRLRIVHEFDIDRTRVKCTPTHVNPTSGWILLLSTRRAAGFYPCQPDERLDPCLFLSTRRAAGFYPCQPDERLDSTFVNPTSGWILPLSTRRAAGFYPCQPDERLESTRVNQMTGWSLTVVYKNLKPH